MPPRPSSKGLKVFTQMQIKEAEAYAQTGEQALHLHFIVFDHSPSCFKRDVNQGLPIAHLLDQNLYRLLDTARRFGVNVRVVERQGTSWQHIDLCGTPLRRLLRSIKDNIENYRDEN